MHPTDRRELLGEANQASIDARDAVGFDEIEPIDVYRMAQLMGVRVRFLDVSMEGFYRKSKPAQIVLSSLRPMARRAFTCGHEIGHHWFGHGSTIDELQKDDRAQSDQPDEILANGFSGFLLMPPLGIRRAFATRGWTVETASPEQMLTVATEFGVGYGTLISHLHWSLRLLSKPRFTELDRVTPRDIRQNLLGLTELTGMGILDGKSLNAAVELEIGNGLLLPAGTRISGTALTMEALPTGHVLYRASRRGLSTMSIENRTIEARVWPARYIGLAAHRYLEDPDD